MSDFWMDEILSLFDYWMQPEFIQIFTSYPVPNNHILFSAFMWCWYRLAPDTSEFYLRLPFFLMLVLLVLWLSSQRQRFPQTHWIIAFSLGFSPVLLQFWLELRGYGISMFLATLTAIGSWDIVKGSRLRGFLWMIPGLLLLPGIIPTNIIFLVCQISFIAIASFYSGQLRAHFFILILASIFVLIGLSLYIPVADQMFYALQEKMGWDSSWETFGHIIFALFVQLAIPCLILVIALYQYIRTSKNSPQNINSDIASNTTKNSPQNINFDIPLNTPNNSSQNINSNIPLNAQPNINNINIAPDTIVGTIKTDDLSPNHIKTTIFYAFINLFLACLLIAIPIFIRHPSPFPRVFLVFFPLFIIIIAQILEKFPIKLFTNSFILLLIFLLNYCMISGITENTTQKKCIQGQYPQNLLEQHYKKNQALSQIAPQFAQYLSNPKAKICISTGFHQWAVFRYYWIINGGHPNHFFNAFHRTNAQTIKLQQPFSNPDTCDILIVIAGTPKEAEALLPTNINKNALQQIHYDHHCFVLIYYRK